MVDGAAPKAAHSFLLLLQVFPLAMGLPRQHLTYLVLLTLRCKGNSEEDGVFSVLGLEEYHQMRHLWLLANRLEKPRPSGYYVTHMGIPGMVAETVAPHTSSTCSHLDHTDPSSYCPLTDCVSTHNTPVQRQVRFVWWWFIYPEDLAQKQARNDLVIHKKLSVRDTEL